MTDAHQFDPYDALSKLRADSRRLEAEFRDWLTVKQIPAQQRCERHDRLLNIQIEESIRHGLSLGGKFVAVYEPCQDCTSDDRIRAKSEWLRRIGVEDENILHATFENFACRTEHDRANLAATKDFATKNNPRGFVLMMGGVGLGKSHLAVACLRAMEIKNAMFRTQSRMLKLLRDGYHDRRREDVIDRCSSVKLLVLDELGAGGDGRDVLPMLHEVLSTRHAKRLPTIITTNLPSLDKVGEAVGVRVHDRIRQAGAALLTFEGESMRPRFRNKYFE